MRLSKKYIYIQLNLNYLVYSKKMQQKFFVLLRDLVSSWQKPAASLPRRLKDPKVHEVNFNY